MTSDLLESLAGPYLAQPGVAWGRMFSTTGLSVRGKIFAVVNHAGNLMVKVPEARADALEADGRGTRMVMRGRRMREWVEMPPERGAAEWDDLLAEAYAYVDAITP
ncbi:MAG TPA: TfoX/Sxy family protein [Pseudolysinimonas sp.]|nr:TfoX/Sxy family protein [Pseudolysinimonas sp.]